MAAPALEIKFTATNVADLKLFISEYALLHLGLKLVPPQGQPPFPPPPPPQPGTPIIPQEAAQERRKYPGRPPLPRDENGNIVRHPTPEEDFALTLARDREDIAGAGKISPDDLKKAQIRGAIEQYIEKYAKTLGRTAAIAQAKDTLGEYGYGHLDDVSIKDYDRILLRFTKKE